LFAADVTVVVYSGVDLTPPEHVQADVQVVVLEDLDPPAVVADLRARGARSILCEGGATINAALLRAGQVDELELVVAPQLVGGTTALTAVHGPLGVDDVALDPIDVLESHGALLIRYRVQRGV
jgi:5-amino-6-(5-phosphoribosylamino)uracil reductase